jgi:4'-phosphopantetheinyl transferase
MPISSQLTHLDGVLPEDEIHVWHTNVELPEKLINRLLGMLDANEQARAARFLVPDARKQYIISHAFLRIALGRYLQIEPQAVRFCTTTNGKPELADHRNLRFNLSHTEGTAAIAVTRARRVGIDVEKIRDNLNPLELSGRFFSPQECEWLRSRPASEQLQSFFACWTAKEAYIKACGGGLSMGLAGFAVIPKTGNARLQLEIYSQPEESKNWLIWQLDLKPGLCAAIAVEASDLAVRIGEWSPAAFLQTMV